MQGEIDPVIAQDCHNASVALPKSLSRVALFDDIADIAVSETHQFARHRSVHLGAAVREAATSVTVTSR